MHRRYRAVPRQSVAAALLAVVAACGGGDAKDTACPDAEARLGHRVCAHEIPDRPAWDGLTFPAAAVDQNRATTYMVPARSDARLPTLFVDANAFDLTKPSLHYSFLTESFPEFELLSYSEYVELILDPVRREWYSGSIVEFIAPDRDPIFGFVVADQGDSLANTITCEQFREVYDAINDRVDVGSVAAVPAHSLQAQVLESCDVPWFDPSTALDYEVYTNAKGCGTLRRYTLAELAVAEQNAEFGFQDVLVTDEAPLDIETIISGIVTGTRQGELSHLNVRSASRGTPNCYVKGGYDLLAPYEGQLVELDCAANRATVVPITPEQAQDCWDQLRPDPVEVVPIDPAWTDLVGLLDMPSADATERRTGVSRFGSKGANLATLYQRIDSALQLDGFLIPFAYYQAFMANNSWSVDLGNGPETLTFAETIDRYLADASFLTDGAVRRTRLDALRAAMRATPCDPALISALDAKIVEVFGGDNTMVRFRSSSNAEDSLSFNGAGLYNSTSVCLADENDGDVLGPSLCDADQLEERSVCRGLTKVWASLWNMKAYEEREWYGIDQSAVAMAILVDTRTKGELANIVAFNGNPLLQGDDRYLVNAQLGELAVVAAQPGVWPEKDLLTVEDGAVTEIERARGSTELPDGQWVLDDARLRELGAELSTIAGVFPVDEEVPPTADVLVDTEWKIRSDGQLIIKQIRPFVR